MDPNESDFPFDVAEDILGGRTKAEEETRQARKLQAQEEYSHKFTNVFNNTSQGEEIRRLHYEEVKKKKREKAHANRKRARKAKAAEKWDRPGVDPEQLAEELRLKAMAEREWLVESRHNGLKIVFDLAYDHCMLPKEVNSLGFQLCHSYSVLRKCTEKLSLNLCSCAGKIREVVSHLGGDFWQVNMFKEPFEVVFQDRLKDVVYLSPDGEEAITEFVPTKIYVIGGLVDNTIIKNQSKNRAEEAGVVSRRLPLELLEAKGKWRVSLNVNTIVEIIGKYLELQDMKGALMAGLPSKYQKYSEACKKEREKSDSESNEEEKSVEGLE
jgi:tRNA (guanine9-N1)-methyltransferase